MHASSSEGNGIRCPEQRETTATVEFRIVAGISPFPRNQNTIQHVCHWAYRDVS